MTHTIAAAQVELVLVALRAGMSSRWAAMSAHVHTQNCNRRGGAYRIPSPSLAGPMSRGELFRAIDRTLCQGRRECLATFGTGMRDMQAEANVHTLRA